MQKLSKKLKLFLYLSFAAAIIAVILLSISIFTAYDESKNYFDRSLLPILSLVFIAISVISAIISFAVIPKGELSGDTPLTLPVTVASVISAIALFISAIVIYGVAFDFGTLSDKFKGIANNSQILLILAGIFSLVAAVYFILNCFMTYADKKEPLALAGFSVPIVAVLYVALCYFDTSVSMNSDIKLLFHYSAILFMLWMLYEIRAIISAPCPRVYFALGLITVTLSAVSSIPWLVGFAAGQLEGPANPSYIIYSIISLGICIYTATRILVFVSARSLLERIADQTQPDEIEFPSLNDEESEEKE